MENGTSHDFTDSEEAEKSDKTDHIKSSVNNKTTASRITDNDSPNNSQRTKRMESKRDSQDSATEGSLPRRSSVDSENGSRSRSRRDSVSSGKERRRDSIDRPDSAKGTREGIESATERKISGKDRKGSAKQRSHTSNSIPTEDNIPEDTLPDTTVEQKIAKKKSRRDSTASSVDSGRSKESGKGKREGRTGSISRKALVQRRILFLADTWSSTKEGITGINHSLISSLARFKGIEIYCAVMEHEDAISEQDLTEAAHMHVKLLFPAVAISNCNVAHLFESVNRDPWKIYPSFFQNIKSVTHIVGHAPLTCLAALLIRDHAFKRASVIMMYHVIPRDLYWMERFLPYKLPTEDQLVYYGTKSDVVYCVNQKVYIYFASLFRNRADKKIDMRLFRPRYDEKLFRLPRVPTNWKERSGEMKLLIMDDGYGVSLWSGTDIAAGLADKVLAANTERSSKEPLPILNVLECTYRVNTKRIESDVSDYLKTDDIRIHIHAFRSPDLFMKTLAEADLCIIPCRGEPFGAIGLLPLTLGVPTLMSENSSTTGIFHTFTEHPTKYIAPIAKTRLAVLQDASIWRDRVITLMQNPEELNVLSHELRTALKRDEASKQSYDNFLSLCLGGVRLKFLAREIYLDGEYDIDLEIITKRNFNKFLCELMKQVWRLKHHPSVTPEDLITLIPGVSMPMEELRLRVLNKVEDMDRQVIEVEPDTLSFVVYCPTLNSLWDMWCLSDVITGRFKKIIFNPSNKILEHFGLVSASLDTHIGGPEFLKYKRQLMDTTTRTYEMNEK